MKKLFTIIGVIGALVLFCAGDMQPLPTDLPPPLPNGTVPGRYQLFTATTDGVSLLYRIDTATGKVWFYNSSVVPGVTNEYIRAEGWMPIDESYMYDLHWYQKHFPNTTASTNDTNP
jgi:hypothetical protein